MPNLGLPELLIVLVIIGLPVLLGLAGLGLVIYWSTRRK